MGIRGGETLRGAEGDMDHAPVCPLDVLVPVDAGRPGTTCAKLIARKGRRPWLLVGTKGRTGKQNKKLEAHKRHLVCPWAEMARDIQ